MSSNATLARPYARAAFESARAAGQLGDWENKLAFVCAVLAHPQAHGSIGNPRLTTAQIIGLLMPEGEPPQSTFAAFLATLADNRRLNLLPDVAQLFAALKRDHDNVLQVIVRTAVAVDPAQADALSSALKRRFKREIDLQLRIDPTVIGGAVIDAGEIVIDGSVRGRLDRLAQALSA